MKKYLWAAVVLGFGGAMVWQGVAMAQSADERRVAEERRIRELEVKAKADKEAKGAAGARITPSGEIVLVDDDGNVVEEREEVVVDTKMEQLDAEALKRHIGKVKEEIADLEKAGKQVGAGLRRRLEELAANLRRVERGEAVWRLAPQHGRDELFDPGRDLRRMDARLHGGGPMGLFGPMPHADAFKIIQNEQFKSTFMLDTRTGETWYLEKHRNGTGFEWRRIEREMPPEMEHEPRPFRRAMPMPDREPMPRGEGRRPDGPDRGGVSPEIIEEIIRRIEERKQQAAPEKKQD